MKQRILIVEPQADLARQMADYLKRHGYLVAIARSATDALAKIESFEPDLIVLELDLQGHNGVEVLYEIRSYEDLQALPVIIYSFRHPASFTQGLERYGVKTYLYKPQCRFSRLVDEIREELELTSKTS